MTPLVYAAHSRRDPIAKTADNISFRQYDGIKFYFDNDLTNCVESQYETYL
jgi:hypothetical protein